MSDNSVICQSAECEDHFDKLEQQLKETQEKLEKHELLYSKHKKLKEQLDEANEVIGFYGDRYSWETWKCEDFKAYGGKKAREYLTKYKAQ